MALDHYASLGVTRTSESVVIRAAYLALMRQYHPDANIAPQADARVREINAAYDVLGNAAKRREYDRGLDWGAPTRETNFGHRPPGVGPMAFGITILTVSALVWGIWAHQGPRDVSATAAAATTSGATGTRPFGEEACLSARVDAIVRRDLLHYANSVRGLPGLDLPQLTDKLMIQTTATPSLIDSKPEAVACKLTITVKAPSGFTFPDGMRAVVGTARYLLGREGLAKDEIIEFQIDPQLIANVASVQESAPPQRLSSPGPQLARNLAKSDLARRLRASSSVPVTRETDLKARRAATQSPKQRRPTPAEPPCDERNSVASPICNDASLTALDGQLTVFEGQSVYYADAAKRDKLKQSRLQFERNREQCRTKMCVRDAIVRRLIHVANIMSNKGGSNPSDGRGASRP